MKILFATEELTARPSEGLLVFAMHLCRFLRSKGELTALHAHGDPEQGFRAFRVLSARTLVTRKLLRLFRSEKFDILIYIPSSGLTPFGLGRGLLMRTLSKSPTILIALQEREVGGLHRLISKLGRPELILSPVKELRRKLDNMGMSTGFIMPGYDDTLFRPVDPREKHKLRSKYGLPADRYLVLHVGHIKESRNMQVFLRYREWGNDVQPVIKCGEVDTSWRDRLRLAGAIVIDEYIANMHELYQAADCYLFPVSCPLGALEFPLSVIEASACNLPVLATRFGALPDTIAGGKGFVYFERASEIPAKLSVLRGTPPQVLEMVEGLSWKMVFERYLAPHLQASGADWKGADR